MDVNISLIVQEQEVTVINFLFRILSKSDITGSFDRNEQLEA